MSTPEHEVPAPVSEPAAAPGPWLLFLGFTRIALNGFGGVLPFAYRGLVEQRRWVEPQEFAALLAASQVMPGPTICNMSLMVGWRFAGLRGALAALAGMMVAPFFIVIGLGLFYRYFGDLAPVRAALRGMSAVAVGLVAATALKMALPLLRQRQRRYVNLLLAAAAFVAMGLLRLPMIAIIAVLAPLGLLLAWKDAQ